MNVSRSSSDNVAVAELRERLGPGARFDSLNAPHDELLLARRGTAYFARKLNELSDGELDENVSFGDWTRRHVIAHIGYHARRLSRIVAAARLGESRELALDSEVNEDIDFACTLPAHALRYLFDHSSVHLNVEWRDLSDREWQMTVRTMSGEPVHIRQTPWLRAKEIWQMALILGKDSHRSDIPPQMLEHILPSGR